MTDMERPKKTRRGHKKPESFREATSKRLTNQWAGLSAEERRQRMEPAIRANQFKAAQNRIERLRAELERTEGILATAER